MFSSASSACSGVRFGYKSRIVFLERGDFVGSGSIIASAYESDGSLVRRENLNPIQNQEDLSTWVRENSDEAILLWVISGPISGADSPNIPQVNYKCIGKSECRSTFPSFTVSVGLV